MKRPQAVILIQERDAVGTIPSTDELSRVDYCGNMVYDRGERRMLLENGYVTERIRDLRLADKHALLSFLPL